MPGSRTSSVEPTAWATTAVHAAAARIFPKPKPIGLQRTAALAQLTYAAVRVRSLQKAFRLYWERIYTV